jgi:hypothetical protein
MLAIRLRRIDDHVRADAGHVQIVARRKIQFSIRAGDS